MVHDVLIIGGGAAGLMAADFALQNGARVILAEAKPSLARKVLMAGKSGLNLTQDQALPAFLANYDGDEVTKYVRDFPPKAVEAWANSYDAKCFTGSSGKVFPNVMKASPLLRGWIGDLQSRGLKIETRWRWIGENPTDWRFETPNGIQRLDAKTAVFALGGASWPRLGSDGAWADRFPTHPFRPANVGFNVNWSHHMAPYFGEWVKNISAQSGEHIRKGEIGITKYGLEGGAIYGLSPNLMAGDDLEIDLMPNQSLSKLQMRWNQTQKFSLGNRLRKMGLSPVARALFLECAVARDVGEIKRLRIALGHARPIAEAISTAGGVRFDALNVDLSMRDWPSVFVAGEMLDWSAPTGGYLLTAAFATGAAAGQAAAIKAGL